MQHGRDFRGLIGHPDDVTAVITDCHREARQIGRRAIAQRSAEAEAGDRDLADVSDRLAGGSDRRFRQRPGTAFAIGFVCGAAGIVQFGLARQRPTGMRPEALLL